MTKTVATAPWHETSDASAPVATITVDFSVDQNWTINLAPITLNGRPVQALGMTFDNGNFSGQPTVTLDASAPLPWNAYTRASVPFNPAKPPQQITITGSNNTDKPVLYLWVKPLPVAADGVNQYGLAKSANLSASLSINVVGGPTATIIPAGNWLLSSLIVTLSNYADISNTLTELQIAELGAGTALFVDFVTGFDGVRYRFRNESRLVQNGLAFHNKVGGALQAIMLSGSALRGQYNIMAAYSILPAGL